MKKKSLYLVIILVLFSLAFTNKNVIVKTSSVIKKVFLASNENNLKTSDLIRIYNSKTGFDFTVKSDTKIEDIKKVYGEPKLVTDSAFGGHAYTFYTDNNYSNYLYVETVLDDAYIFSYGTVWPEYQVYNSGYGYDYPFYDTSNLQGFIMAKGSKVGGGVYYNRNKYIGGDVTNSINYFVDNYNSNPTKYLKGISKQGILMYKALSKFEGYETNFEFNEEYFYINEQMKDNGMTIRSDLIQSMKTDALTTLGFIFEYELNSSRYYLFNPAVFANFFFTDGLNRTNMTGKKTIAIFDYDMSHKQVSAIVMEPGALEKTKKVELTSEEKTKLDNAQNLYNQYKEIINTHGDNDTAYDANPVVTPAANLFAGKVKSDYLNASVKYINTIKAGLGFPYLNLEDDLTQTAQYDAVLLSYRNKELGLEISHAPAQPAGVSDEFYKIARGQNLKYGFGENVARVTNDTIDDGVIRSITNKFMDDTSDLSKSFGHREALLNPRMKSLGLGYAPNIGVMRFQTGYDTSNIQAVTWPAAGITPIEALDVNRFYWSVHFINDYTVTENTNVKVECLNTGDSWEFKSSEAELNGLYKPGKRQYIIVTKHTEETKNRLIFYDETIYPRPDYVYKVTVSNIRDKNNNVASYSYRTVFKKLSGSADLKTSNTIKIDRSNLISANETNTYYVPIGQETKFFAKLDEGTKDTKVTWSTDNANVSITQNGTINPKSIINGKIKITVKYDALGITDSIYVKTYNPNQISLSSNSLSINANDSKTLTMQDNTSLGNIQSIEWKVASYDDLSKLYAYNDAKISSYLEITKINDKSINIKAISYPSTNKFKITVKVTTNTGTYYGYSDVIVKILVTDFRLFHNNNNNNGLGSVTNSPSEHGFVNTTVVNRDVLYKNNQTYIAKFKVNPEPKNATEIPEFKWEIIENDGCISETNEKGAYKLNKIGKAKIKVTNMSNTEHYNILRLKVTDNNNDLTGIQLIGDNLLYLTKSYLSLYNYIETDDGTSLDWNKVEINVDGMENTYTIRDNSSIDFSGNYLGNTYVVNIKYNNSNVKLTVKPITEAKISEYTLTARKTSATLKNDEKLSTSIYFKPNDYFGKNKLFINELSFDIYYDKNYVNVSSATSSIPNVNVKVYTDRINVTYKATDGPVILDSKDLVNLELKAIKNVDVTTYVELKNIKVKTGLPTNQVENVEASEKITINIVKYIPITGITLNKNSDTIAKGSSVDLIATIIPGDTTESKTIKWSSSNRYIASVDSNGKVTGVTQGTATITAKASNGMTATCTITVTNPITDISLSATSISIKAGDFKNLTATITPSNTTDDKTITWSSSNTNIATVVNGKVTGVKAGTATITAKTSNGKTAKCTVTVTESTVVATGISLNKTSISILKGNNETLTATITPSNATDKTVTWTSSNTNIATVVNGKVTGVKAGSATITAKTTNGKTANCTVTVTESTVVATGISLNKTSISIVNGSSETLTATITPSNATDKTVTWTSSDSNVATVVNGKVTGVKAGTATITAKTSNGKTAKCTVTVTESTVVVTGISLNKTSISIVNGSSETLTATITPSNATDKTVTWTSSDSSIATVVNGKVTGVKAGSATITAKTSNGKTAKCTVTVTAKTTPPVEPEMVPVYRLYNPVSLEHLYTTDAHEVEVLYKQYGWGKEGIGWYSPTNGTPVYRLYNPILRNHLYTSDQNEINIITRDYGWIMDNDGKPLMYSSGDIPIYRLYNPLINGMHHLTTDKNEYNVIPAWGWQQEGISMKAVKIGVPEITHYYNS